MSCIHSSSRINKCVPYDSIKMYRKSPPITNLAWSNHQSPGDFVYHKENGAYIRTIDMMDNENMRTMHGELLEKHPSVEIRVW